MKVKERTERKRPPAAIIWVISPVCLHYLWSTTLQDVVIAHSSKGCLAGEHSRQTELRIAECIIAHQV